MDGEAGGQEFSGGGETQGQAQPETGSINPAWNEMLGALPQEYHSQVVPHLQRWDKGVQDRFQQVHSQYEGYKPFVENQITPDEINFAMGLLNAVNSDPLSVRQALNAWIEQEGIEGGGEGGQQPDFQSYGEQGQQGQFDLTQHPDYQRMSQMVEEMANVMVSQREQEQQSQADQQLDDELNSLKEKFGDYDETFVLARMAAGMPGEQAVQEFFNFANSIRSQQRAPGPKVLGAGGSLPKNDVDVRKMDSKSTRSLVENMLRNASQQT